jgi:hypothetical protein
MSRVQLINCLLIVLNSNQTELQVRVRQIRLSLVVGVVLVIQTILNFIFLEPFESPVDQIYKDNLNSFSNLKN